jgi:TetR/AcrR family transcriptional repressor of nem operon
MEERALTKGEATRERILETAESLFLARGYAGTSIDDILRSTGLTKGGFFYHFSSKAVLSMAVVERYAIRDFELFDGFAEQADAASDDPLEALFIFLELFEAFIDDLNGPPAGCIFASYLYEVEHLGENVRKYIADGFEHWGNMYASRIEDVMAIYPAAIEVNARELSQMIMCIIEGGFILSKSFKDPAVTSGAARQFRQYLGLIFGPVKH